MTRLTYENTDNGLRQSRKVFLLPTGQIVRVVLNGLFFEIVETTSKEVLVAAQSQNSVGLKKDIRNSLVNLGVTFNPDVRTRTPKEVTNVVA